MHPALVGMPRIGKYDPMGFHFPPKTATPPGCVAHTFIKAHRSSWTGSVSAGFPRKRFFQLIAQLLWDGYIISFIFPRRTKGPSSVNRIFDDFKKRIFSLNHLF